VDLKLSNALFEMLVPPAVKDRIGQGGDLLLLVDGDAARYPFELMAERVGEEPHPLAIERGLLRQLGGDGSRGGSQPAMGPNTVATGRSMLVIGAPQNVKPPLPGAIREAKTVADVATARGYQPAQCIDTGSRAVITELFARDYRMLHVAAHGRFCKNPLESGVVIGDGEYLTVADVQSLHAVPELVFLNACHSGQFADSPLAPLPQLAASLAVAFMDAGARAVVAAGWAVDDDAALLFADRFYNRFLAGERFGEAVKAARQAVHGTYPSSNTWGAYQCYGNPDYRLPDPFTARSASRSAKLVSRSEVVAALRSLAARAGGARGEAARALAQDFSSIRDGVSDRWKDGGVFAELANVAAELEDFEQAAALYGQALATAKALAPISAVEQLVNVLGRQAPKLWLAKTPAANEAALAVFRQAEEWLDWLDKKLALTPERAALRGSLHKRWALVTSGADRRAHLKRAEAAYRKARELGKDKKSESYQLLNWLAFRFVNRAKPESRTLTRLAIDEWERAKEKEKSQGEPDFWTRVAIPDALLHVRLFEGTLSDPARLREVEDEYARALKTAPTARELASTRDHVDFLSEMLADLRPAQSAALLPALDRVRRLLTS
jgi:hypothetical protein